MPTLDNHASSHYIKVMEEIWGDFTLIRVDGDYLIFVDQSTNKITGRVILSCVEVIEDGELWKGDI